MNPIVEFVKSAAELKMPIQHVQFMLKESTGQDISPEQLQAILGMGGQGGGPQGGPQGGPGGAMAGGPQGGPGGPGGDMGIDPHELQQLEHQFKNVSPEELEQIAQAIAEQIQMSEMGGQGGPGQEGQTGMGDMPPQGADPGAPGGSIPKQASYDENLAKVASIPYIYGFLKQATEVHGYSLPRSVDLYGRAYVISREMIHEKQASASTSAAKVKLDDKTAAYLEDFYKHAKARGLSDDAIVSLAKNSDIYSRLVAQQ